MTCSRGVSACPFRGRRDQWRLPARSGSGKSTLTCTARAGLETPDSRNGEDDGVDIARSSTTLWPARWLRRETARSGVPAVQPHSLARRGCQHRLPRLGSRGVFEPDWDGGPHRNGWGFAAACGRNTPKSSSGGPAAATSANRTAPSPPRPSLCSSDEHHRQPPTKATARPVCSNLNGSSLQAETRAALHARHPFAAGLAARAEWAAGALSPRGVLAVIRAAFGRARLDNWRRRPGQFVTLVLGLALAHPPSGRVSQAIKQPRRGRPTQLVGGDRTPPRTPSATGRRNSWARGPPLHHRRIRVPCTRAGWRVSPVLDRLASPPNADGCAPTSALDPPHSHPAGPR